MAIIEIKNITKRFNDKLVLDNISYEINKGEIFGFIGPNGAGKSTLINIMTSLLVPDSGSVKICGYDIVKESLKAKANIGYVPQDIALLEELSAYDNLEFFGALYGLKGKLLKERIKEALEVTGLEDKRKQKVKKFSGGMKRRLNIATAIMHHPKVLIMDEPTVGVDPQSRNHIFTFTKKICKEWGTTVIYTSHYMEEVEELCERVFIIDLGKEIAYGNKEDIKSSVFPNNKVIIDASNMSGEALIKLETVEGILKIVDNENLITLTINSNFKLGNALNILEKENVIIKKISYEEAKLEDVFLTLTGKNLRD
ncbi:MULTISPECIES: ABC transporter ATP-binding protein [Clostridium]|uniref:ABC transporter ATP-binding protein n=1 Tax=Clostridium TaxID=1485 RepID=UPI000668E69C|nr:MULTISPECIES: ABC transporter ATP-binding protein [Clostridium]MBS7131126.1 ABC transporter ATP-binding protein [Clostridium sp.]MDB2076824.1 ABC transporter ATP-binding protein [Clostridium paraputrificum]MDB2080345.1 ABC transporter ATP-binding protein [Clostridium paraputrificum]MDB2093753.1 ABC transporter ATP-binding protein [Clostridium paraputrificum]MDB2100525.1 ABC transporter ATP-binding protein [Clostridium paraputrificum]